MQYCVLGFLKTRVSTKMTYLPFAPLCITENIEKVVAVIQKLQIDDETNLVKIFVYRTEAEKSYSLDSLQLQSKLFMCAVRYHDQKWIVYYGDRRFRTEARKLAGLGHEVKGRLGQNMFFAD